MESISEKQPSRIAKPVVTAGKNFRLSANHERNQSSLVLTTPARLKVVGAYERDYESTK